MRIEMLSRWNTACRVSFHAELVGREWIKMGHKLTIFASKSIRPIGEDEEYVIRCSSIRGTAREDPIRQVAWSRG